MDKERIKNIARIFLKYARHFVYRVFLAAVVAGLMFVILSPLFGIVLRGFMSRVDISNPLVFMIPMNFTLDQFRTAYNLLNFRDALIYTVIVGVCITAVQVAVCALTGYGFARFEFPGKTVLFGAVIVTIVVPTSAYYTSMYMQFRFFDFAGLYPLLTGERGFSLLGTLGPIFILTVFGMGVSSGLFIFIFRQFFRNMPKELEESAFIDGAHTLRTFWSIIMPNAKPAIITVALFTFVWDFNGNGFKHLLSAKPDFISIRLEQLGGAAYGYIVSTLRGGEDLVLMALIQNAGFVIFIIPLMVMYVIVQKSFIEGVERSGIVG